MSIPQDPSDDRFDAREPEVDDREIVLDDERPIEPVADPGPGLDDEREVVLDDDEELDDTYDTPTAPEEIELRAQLEREMRFDGFEQGIQG